jgi:hypothetical protein
MIEMPKLVSFEGSGEQALCANKGFLHFGKMSGTIWSNGLLSFTGVLDIFGALIAQIRVVLPQVVTHQ